VTPFPDVRGDRVKEGLMERKAFPNSSLHTSVAQVLYLKLAKKPSFFEGLAIMSSFGQNVKKAQLFAKSLAFSQNLYLNKRHGYTCDFCKKLCFFHEIVTSHCLYY